MSFPTRAPRRTRVGRLAVAAGIAVAATSGTLLLAGTAGATVSTIDTITAVGPHLVAATTVNQLITVTGTGFDESTIASVAVQGCTAPTYIVASPTSLLVKTDATCVAGANKTVTITDTAGGVAVSNPAATGGAQALTFVAPPTIAVASATVRPVMTDNTAGLSYAAQTAVGTSASTKGGAVIRVISGATGFSNSAATPLSATLDGVALSKVTLVGTNGTAGNYFTGVLGAHAADAAPVLKITNNGVSKSFAYGAPATAGTFDFQIGGSTIAVAPAFGASEGGNKITVTGTGFSTTAANDTVTVGGVACPVSGVPTATSIVCTVPAAASPYVGPQTVKVVVTGGLTSAVTSGSTYTYVAQ
ncbi:MAG: hypothetical protein JWQ32_2041 [Marmoricola sp.]|nr:hypothetical protein [Marmoricola sp.]